MYEKITGKTFDLQTMEDMIIFFYSMLIAAGEFMEFGEFVDCFDEDPNLITEFVAFKDEANQVNEVFIQEEDSEGGQTEKK